MSPWRIATWPTVLKLKELRFLLLVFVASRKTDEERLHLLWHPRLQFYGPELYKVVALVVPLQFDLKEKTTLLKLPNSFIRNDAAT